MYFSMFTGHLFIITCEVSIQIFCLFFKKIWLLTSYY